METIDIKELLHESSYPCISISLPSGKLSDLEQSVSEARSLLEKVDIPDKIIAEMVGALNSIDQNAFDPDCSGWGIYVSPTVSGVVSFPFRVNRKICLDQGFDSSYLLPLVEDLELAIS